jgi:DNA replication protein DnaC
MSSEKATIHQFRVVPNPSENESEESFQKYLDSGDEPEVCPLCYGSGMEFIKGGVRPCKCRKLKAKDSLLEKLQIPSRYQKSDFQNFQSQHASQLKAYSYATKLAMEYPAIDQGLLLMGNFRTYAKQSFITERCGDKFGVGKFNRQKNYDQFVSALQIR